MRWLFDLFRSAPAPIRLSDGRVAVPSDWIVLDSGEDYWVPLNLPRDIATKSPDHGIWIKPT